MFVCLSTTAQQQPVPSDPEGKLLQMVLRFRELRKKGVKAELARIKQHLQKELLQLQEALSSWRDEEDEQDSSRQWQCDAGGQGAACSSGLEGGGEWSAARANAAAAGDRVHTT